MNYEPRFSHAQPAYREFRPIYPATLFERILAALAPAHRRRAVDLGAGTGLSSLPLCDWFEEVIAVEPDAKMAEALHGRHKRLRVLNSMAERCELPAGSVDLVTSGTAFHWMDGEQVLERIAGWLQPKGLLAVYRYDFPRLPKQIWYVLRREFIEHWGAFRHPRLLDADYTRRTVEKSLKLRVLSVETLPNVWEWDAVRLAGFCRSTSYGSAYVKSLADPERYAAELEKALEDAAHGAPFPVDFALELTLARKA